MRARDLLAIAGLLALGVPAAARAQYVEPLKVLEQSRREGVETDRRLARERAAWEEKVRADRAAAEARRKLDEAKAPPAPSPTPTPAPPDGTPPSPAMPNAASPGSAASAGVPPEAASRMGAAPAAAPAPSAHPVATPPAQAEASPPHPPPPRVRITVDKAAQRMRVVVDGKLRHTWAVSTGRAGYETPSGTFRPLWLARTHYSREWDDAPMPHSIFFTTRGHAIHGSTATGRLGRRASHGCVRLAPSDAATLFKLVQAQGPSGTEVTVTGGGRLPRTAARTDSSRRSR